MPATAAAPAASLSFCPTIPAREPAMSRLRIFSDTNPDAPDFTSHDGDEIARELAKIGVRFERWQASQPVAAGASQEEVNAAAKAALDEHYHKEDEVRFFVEGSGLFTLHVGDKVYEIECVKNDLIAVPDGTTHWFDMGPEPNFVAIRFFQQPDGWIGHFTGTDIAQKF